MLILLITLLALLVLLVFLIDKSIRTKYVNRPDETYPKGTTEQHKKPLVICLGDSNTHGNVSYNWVKDLITRHPSVTFKNAGINADLTFSVLKRLSSVIESQPDYVVLLIGTNDLNATLRASNLKSYLKRGKISESELPNEKNFETNLAAIVTQIKANTKARLALVSLPLITEQLEAYSNQKADNYSDIIKKISLDNGLAYLPFREKQKEYLAQNPSKRSKLGYQPYKILMNISIFTHYAFGVEWEKISHFWGNQLLIDQLHQNKTSATLLLNLLNDWLENNVLITKN